jgi:hypothetical protein
MHLDGRANVQAGKSYKCPVGICIQPQTTTTLHDIGLDLPVQILHEDERFHVCPASENS